MDAKHERFLEIRDAVLANSAKLRKCSRHHFDTDTTPENTFAKIWKCSRCEGTVNTLQKLWYERGLEHGERERPIPTSEEPTPENGL